MIDTISKVSFLGQRHLQVFLLFLGIIVNNIPKFSTSVAVVAMTNANTTNSNFSEYDWTEKEKSYILSSFFWGYCLTQFPGGYTERRFGAKITIFIATVGSSVIIAIVPFCVTWGNWKVYCILRLMQGLCQGFIFPSVHSHLASWCPANEVNRLGALANTGIECGTVLSIVISGVIASSDLGWPGIFYISGALSGVWSMFWFIYAVNTPKESKSISETELKYIESTRSSITKKEAASTEPKKLIPIPWKAILTSAPFWSLVVVRSAHSWGFSTLQAEIPSYMNGVMGLHMQKNTLFSALPYLLMWCSSYIFIFVSDVLLYQKWLSLNAIRKGFNSIGTFAPSIALIAVGCLNKEDQTTAIVLLTIGVGLSAGTTIGSTLNTIDLSPNHAGILMGIVNTMANVIPIITPLLVGIIVQNKKDQQQWKIVFIISALILTAGNLFYISFGSTKQQPWDDDQFLQSEKKNKSEDLRVQA